MRRNELLSYLEQQLNVANISDYCPNGLQVEGRDEITRIVTGVSASQALIDTAIEYRADALLVHHGYFWKGEPAPVVGMKRNRLKALLQHDINLIAYHLPLDCHPRLGNNAQLATMLGLQDSYPLSGVKPDGVVTVGQLPTAIAGEQLRTQLESRLGRSVLHSEGIQRPLQSVAICTGGGQGYIEAVADAGIDAFITGEVSEQTIHVSREMGIDFFAAGHHATERYGIKALGEHLQQQFALDVRFVDIDNPA